MSSLEDSKEWRYTIASVEKPFADRYDRRSADKVMKRHRIAVALLMAIYPTEKYGGHEDAEHVGVIPGVGKIYNYGDEGPLIYLENW